MQEICHVLLMLDSLSNRQVTFHTLRRTRADFDKLSGTKSEGRVCGRSRQNCGKKCFLRQGTRVEKLYLFKERDKHEELVIVEIQLLTHVSNGF